MRRVAGIACALMLLVSWNEGGAQQGDACSRYCWHDNGCGATRFGLLEARISVLSSWNAGAAFAYLDSDGGRDELQLRLMSSNTMARGPWAFDWRQMVSVSSRDLIRFRSRIRMARSVFLRHEAFSLRAYDDPFVALEGAGVLRNNIAAGFGLQLQERCSAELYHVWVDNRVGRQSDFELVLLTLLF